MSGIGGTGVFLAFPTWDLAPLAWFTLVPTYLAAKGTSGKQHFLIGWWAGTITNIGGFWWIGGMLMDFGHMPFLPAAVLTVLLGMYQGLVFALSLWLLHWLQRRSSLGVWLLAPIAYVSAEILLPFVFPWYYANSQYWVIPFIQICELGGVTFLSFMMVMTNALLVDAFGRFRNKQAGLYKPLVAAVLVPVLIGGYGLIRIGMVDSQAAAAPYLNIGLVEADVGIWEKEDPKKVEDNLVSLQRMSIELEKQGADLIVWPETAYHAPFTYVQRAGDDQVRYCKDEGDLKRCRPIPRDVTFISSSETVPPKHAADDRAARTPMADRVAPQRGFKTPLLFGALTAKPNPENKSPRHPGIDLMNTAILIDAQGNVLGAYDKVYLLIFGEYIPLGHTFPVFYEWLPEGGDLTAGDSVEVIPFGDFRIGVMVCYEDIIPAFTREVADKDPNILINITNDAWFGKTSEPYLHLALAVFRSVENRVPLVRSTNTGVSCFVDPVGRIIAETGLDDAETLLAKMPMMDGGTVYQILGDWPAYLCLLSLPLIWFRARKRKRR
ncbi:MAG: apolipoprotein N-acyltransferase [Deltaproteobacteria bacterium]|nr:apolipoprotein N-acyltransferase [Deltaproteobacteria bacterium]